MAFYYVKSGFGTNTGAASSTTQRSGAFSAMTAGDTYADIATVFAQNTIATGDFICCSSAHDATSSGFTGASTYFCTIISVDDSNADQYLAGATESTTGTYSITQLTMQCVVYGMTFGGKLTLDNDAQGFQFFDCTFNGINDVATFVIGAFNDPHVAEFYNCTFNSTYDGTSIPAMIYARYNPRLVFDSCTFNYANTGTNFYFMDQGNLDGFEVRCNNCIFSGTGSMTLIDTAGISDQEGACTVTLSNCRFPSSWSFYDSAPLTLSMDVSVWNCDDGVKYITGRSNFWGTSITQSTYARSGGASVDGTGIAYEVTTTSNPQDEICGHRFLLTTVSADFSTAKTVTVYMQYSDAGATDLQDDEIWIEVHVPKASTPDMTVYSSKLDSNGQGGVVWTDAPADYSNNTETWSGSLANAVKQQMSITTAGSEDSGLAQVYVVVAKPSTTVYVCPAVDVS